MKRFIYRVFRFSYVLEGKAKRRLTTSGFWVASCLTISLFIGGDTNQSQNGTYQITALLFSILAIGIACSLSFRDRFSATRILPRFGTAGVKLKYRILIHNQNNKIQQGLNLLEKFADPRPTFKEFIQIPDPGEDRRNSFDKALGYYRWLWLISRKQCATAKVIDLPPIAANSKTEVVAEITPSHRGVIRLTGLTIARPDPFGLINACITISLPQSLLILPKLYNLPPVELPGSRRYQSGGVALASSVGDSEEFKSLRDYRPGDSLRKIHWKSWAKVGKPIVKEEQDEFFVRHALILDTYQKVKYSEILEEAISIAASLACEVQTQESLLDLMFVGDKSYCFTIGRGLSHTDRMLEILASVVACQDKYFDCLLAAVSERVSLLSGCICILIDWDDDRKKLVNYLKNNSIHTLVLILVNSPIKLSKFAEDFANDEFTQFHILNLENIQEELRQL